jgi:cytochrome c551/c552
VKHFAGKHAGNLNKQNQKLIMSTKKNTRAKWRASAMPPRDPQLSDQPGSGGQN